MQEAGTMQIGPFRRLVLGGAVLLTAAVVMPAGATLAAADSPPGVAWTDQFGSPGEDWGRGLAVDGSGVYVVGHTGGALPGQSSFGGSDAWIRRYDLDGSEVWTRQFGSPGEDWGRAVAVDGSGVYVTGNTDGALAGQTNAGSFDAWIRKYDLDGNEVWTRQFGTTGGEWSHGVAVNGGGVYLIGHTEGAFPGRANAGGTDVWVRRYDLDGNEQWTDQFGTSGIEGGFGVAVGTDGVYLTGHTRGAFPGHGNAGETDVWVRRYDFDGTEQWTDQFGTTDVDWSFGVAAGASGVYLAGHAYHAGTYSYDVWVRSYDPDGNERWTREFDAAGDPISYDYGQAVAVDGSGAYVTGHTQGWLPDQTSAGGFDVWVRKYDSDGNEQWTRQFGTTGDDEGFGVAVSASGTYLAGTTLAAFPGQTNGGSRDVWVRRYQPGAVCGDAAVTIAGTDSSDIITGTSGDDVIDARGGNDLIDARGGNDIICAGPGDDSIAGGFGDDVVFGQAGKDWIDYRTAPAGVTVNLTDQWASGGHGKDALFGVEHAYGTAYDDLLIGDEGVNRLAGRNGNDTLHGRAGNDTLNGGYGNDTASYVESPSGVVADLVAGTATGRGDDDLNSIEQLDGSGHRDILRGNWLVNRLRGQGGNDTLWGGGAADILNGGAGNDYLYGQAGDDYLYGTQGTDTANGGPGTNDYCRAETTTNCER